MTDSDTTPIEEKATGGADYRQVGFVILAAVALILTAFVAPSVSNPGSGPGNGGGDVPSGSVDLGVSDSPNVSFDLPGISFNWRDLVSWLSWINGDNGGECSVYIGRIVPGSRVEVVVRYRGQPLSDAPVWFNDRQIGYTNEMGIVSGRVPYTEVLRVRVGVPGDTKCKFVRANPQLSVGRAGLSITEFELQMGLRETQSNATVEYTVEGDVDFAVEGKPYPGETVVIEASIKGVPMRQASVEVDGVPVGRTDDDGRVTVRVPNDGSEQFEVRVSRGDFTGTATVDVLLLDVSLRPEGIAVVPGTTAIVVARLGNQPVEGAVVTINGERRGTTGPNGTLAVELPLDPTATVTISTGRQTASTSVAAMYRIVVPLLALLVLALTVAVYRIRDLRSAIIVPIAVGAGLAVVIADAVWGPAGLLASVLAIGALVVVAALIRWKRTDGMTMSVSPLRRITEWVIGAALRIVRKLEQAIVRARRLMERVRLWVDPLPRSITGLLNRFGLWIRSVPERALVVLGRVPLVMVAIAVVCVAALVTGYAVAEIRGVVVVSAVLILGLIARWYPGRNDTDTDTDTTTESDPTKTSSSKSTATAEMTQPSFRELWRAFARRIDPSRWRTRAPGEIARAAIDQEYPDEQVYELTTLFCEVEYGGRSYSDTVRERAEDAYNTIETHPPAEAGGENR